MRADHYIICVLICHLIRVRLHHALYGATAATEVMPEKNFLHHAYTIRGHLVILVQDNPICAWISMPFALATSTMYFAFPSGRILFDDRPLHVTKCL